MAITPINALSTPWKKESIDQIAPYLQVVDKLAKTLSYIGQVSFFIHGHGRILIAFSKIRPFVWSLYLSHNLYQLFTGEVRKKSKIDKLKWFAAVNFQGAFVSTQGMRLFNELHAIPSLLPYTQYTILPLYPSVVFLDLCQLSNQGVALFDPSSSADVTVSMASVFDALSVGIGGIQVYQWVSSSPLLQFWGMEIGLLAGMFELTAALKKVLDQH